VQFDVVCYYLLRDGLFRGPQGQLSYIEDKQDEIRIICLGDSTTYGLMIDYYKTWPYLLEESLKRKYPSKNINVLNAGIPGASSRQLKRIFQFHLAKFKPDIVIWRDGGFLTDSYEVTKTTNFLRIFLWRMLYESRIFRIMCIIIDNKQHLNWLNPVADRVYDFIMGDSSQKKNNVRKFNSDFNMVAQLAVECGTKYILAVDYVIADNLTTLRSDYNYLQEKGIHPLVITFDSFKEKLKSVDMTNIFIDGCHLTEIGTSIVANDIFEFIVTEKWIESL